LIMTLDRVEVTLMRISGRGLPTHQIRSEKLFVDIQTDKRSDTPEFQSIRSSLGNDLKISMSKTVEVAII